MRAAAARMTRFSDATAMPTLHKLAEDNSPQVRRAVAVELRSRYQTNEAPLIWARLAEQFEAGDRWYLEALGLGAEMHWDRCLEAWLARAGEDAWKTVAGRRVVWRSRSTRTAEMLIALLMDEATPTDELPRLLRALDFDSGRTSTHGW